MGAFGHFLTDLEKSIYNIHMEKGGVWGPKN